MKTTAAKKILRAWAISFRNACGQLPLRYTVEMLLPYGEGDIGRAARALGAEKAWEIVVAS